MNWSIHRSLHARGLTQATLAARAGVGRSHLSQVMGNVPGRGGHTRKKLFPHLTPDEILSLGWGIEYADWLEKTGTTAPADIKLLRAKIAVSAAVKTEQSATENIVPNA
jgi:transcriptional regulator with XRE-family HTH domain